MRVSAIHNVYQNSKLNQTTKFQNRQCNFNQEPDSVSFQGIKKAKAYGIIFGIIGGGGHALITNFTALGLSLYPVMFWGLCGAIAGMMLTDDDNSGYDNDNNPDDRFKMSI